MRHALFLAWASLRAGPVRSAVVVLGLAVALFLPLFTARLAPLAEGRLLDRADATPIAVGAAGSAVDLVLAAVYFRGAVERPVSQATVDSLEALAGIDAVPLHLGFTVARAPLVGTTLDYLDRRGLVVAAGRRPAVVGEVVLGATLAGRTRLAPGDPVRSDPRQVYDLAGSYPLVLRVVGVLAPTGSPDDEAAFTDVKTAWTLEGRLHGHAEVAGEGSGEPIEASLAIYLHDEVTPETIPSFHAHGGPADWPVTAVLLFPVDARARDQALGDLALRPDLQAARPREVVGRVLDLVLRVRELLAAWVVLVAASTLAFVGLVTSLVLRLRGPEITLLRRIGAARGRVEAILAAEAAGLLVAAAVVAVAGTWAAERALLAWLGW